jgi:hypothetical protein
LPRSTNFKLNELYDLDRNGYRRARGIRPDLSYLQRSNEQQEAIEEALNQPHENTAEAMRLVQQEHDHSIAAHKASMECQAKQHDASVEDVMKRQTTKVDQEGFTASQLSVSKSGV